MERRDFLKFSIGAGVLAMMQFSGFGCTQKGAPGSTIILPPLPYPKDALEPYLSANTLQYHYGKHHQGYVDKVNALIKGTDLQGISLSHMILNTVDNPTQRSIFNNAAQVFNHTFYWSSMTPLGGGRPTGDVANLLKKSFGSYENFFNAFLTAATTHFGSGWAWLVKKKEGLEIVTTANADTPIAHGVFPLITIDIWEHAYYLDYKNQRKEYVKTFLTHLVNWDFARKNLG